MSDSKQLASLHWTFQQTLQRQLDGCVEVTTSLLDEKGCLVVRGSVSFPEGTRMTSFVKEITISLPSTSPKPTSTESTSCSLELFSLERQLATQEQQKPEESERQFSCLDLKKTVEHRCYWDCKCRQLEPPQERSYTKAELLTLFRRKKHDLDRSWVKGQTTLAGVELWLKEL